MGFMNRLSDMFKSEEEYDECLNEIKKHNGVEIRLPSSEIEQRLSAEFKPYIKGALNLKV